MITSNLYDSGEARHVILRKGPYCVVEYEKDLSISTERAQTAYFASLMNVRKRQLIIDMDGKKGVYAQAGSMQMMMGDLEAAAGVKSVGDFFRKVAGSIVTDETVIKPFYVGEGQLVLEPTFKHILLMDMADWEDGLLIEDGMFLACDETVEMYVSSRKTISSLILGGEGIFNTEFFGTGIVALESPVPSDEIIAIDLVEDTLKIDGNMAIAWSPSLDFTVEKTTGTLVGSFASGEGFVNVYRGTGRVLLAPVRKNKKLKAPDDKN